MSPEEKELFKRSIALAEENNDILRAMQRSQRLAHLMSIIYWIFIVGTAIGAYYFIQPYLDEIKSVYGGAKSTIGEFMN